MSNSQATVTKRVAITSVMPPLIAVVDGGTTVVVVTADAETSMRGARLRFRNSKPATADLFDSNETADIVFSNKLKLKRGPNPLSHEIGFVLEKARQDDGAAITVEISVVNARGEIISNSVQTPAAIFATS